MDSSKLGRLAFADLENVRIEVIETPKDKNGCDMPTKVYAVSLENLFAAFMQQSASAIEVPAAAVPTESKKRKKKSE